MDDGVVISVSGGGGSLIHGRSLSVVIRRVFGECLGGLVLMYLSLLEEWNGESYWQLLLNYVLVYSFSLSRSISFRIPEDIVILQSSVKVASSS